MPGLSRPRFRAAGNVGQTSRYQRESRRNNSRTECAARRSERESADFVLDGDKRLANIAAHGARTRGRWGWVGGSGGGGSGGGGGSWADRGWLAVVRSVRRPRPRPTTAGATAGPGETLNSLHGEDGQRASIRLLQKRKLGGSRRRTPPPPPPPPRRSVRSLTFHPPTSESRALPLATIEAGPTGVEASVPRPRSTMIPTLVTRRGETT